MTDRRPPRPPSPPRPIPDRWMVVVTCRDEAHQVALLDAIDRADGPRLAELLKGAACKALVG